MTSKFSIDNRELLQRISSGEAVVGIDFGNLIVRELAAFRLAAMDSEPVAEITEDLGRLFVKIHHPTTLKAGDKLYRHAQPASERDQVRQEHAEWSQATFGNVGPVGPLKHLSKEVLEAAAEPGYLSEWADMQFLLWDAQRRAGITDEQITQAMIEKLAVNKQREWPEPKDGEPRLHIKEQPAPVVPVVPEGLNHETTDLVLRFASALADKLYKAEQKYGRSTDWMKDDWYDDCLQSLLEHIEKGDPKDVAAYCAFMWHHGWKTKVAQPAQEEQKSISDRQAIFALESAGAVTPIGRAYKMELNACRAAMLEAAPQEGK